jgi:hypothetical protein
MDTQENTPTPDQTATSPAEPPKRGLRRFKPATLAISAILALAILAVGFVAVAKATDSPTFCGSACHEMGPYHTAWSTGAHKDIACVDCHVDADNVAKLKHKFVALQEVVDHVKGGVTFPLSTAPEVPDSRCLRCHANIVVKQAGFSHADHAKRGPCVKCHAEAGHKVSSVALQTAGILNVAYKHAVEPTVSATPGNGPKPAIPGHKIVECTNCHDMTAMKCADCHTPGPKHENRPTDCTVCHQPGVKFVFTHPQRADCVTCHTPPANMKPVHSWKGDCTQCHKSAPGVDWKFTHPQVNTCGDCHARPANHKWDGTCTDCHKAGPGKSFAFSHPGNANCETCHARPAGHKSGSCTTCHHNAGRSWAFSHPSSSANCTTCHAKPSSHSGRDNCTQCHRTGVSWSFNHPSRGANCASCHNRPSGHRSGSCQTCHKNVGKSWSFSHPGSGASCASCHKRPGSHASGSCQNCHRNAGKSWAFSHPSSNSCSSCHTPPSNHYGTNCGSCHTAGTSWKNTHFSHPAIPRGEHTYKSFACSKCHPSGPPAFFCTCHGTTTGPKGD